MLKPLFVKIVILLVIVSVCIIVYSGIMCQGREYFSAIANMFSVFVAVGALILAWRADGRAQVQFTANLELQKKIADASIEPQLTVHMEKSEDERVIVLMNEGLGPAKGVRITYVKGDSQSTTNIRDIMNVPVLSFSYRVDAVLFILDERGIPLGAGNHRDILAITRAHLTEQRLNENQIQQLFQAVDSSLRGMTMRIRYANGFGKEQDEYSINLDDAILIV